MRLHLCILFTIVYIAINQYYKAKKILFTPQHLFVYCNA